MIREHKGKYVDKIKLNNFVFFTLGKIRTLQLSTEQKKALQQGYRNGKSHGLRRRCQVVLLSSEGRGCKEIGGLLGMNQVSVSHWLNRYEAEGIEGLSTRQGRGRKPLLNKEQHGAPVRKAVQQERGRLLQAKAMLEGELSRQFSLKTLKRFLKSLSAATNA